MYMHYKCNHEGLCYTTYLQGHRSAGLQALLFCFLRRKNVCIFVLASTAADHFYNKN